MSRYTERADAIQRRREFVARLRLRQMSQREIVAALAEKGFVNPVTGKPWDVMQINRDLKAIRAEWHAARMAAMDEHAARILAELGEIKRMAIGEKDARAWLAAVKQEAELLGTNAPTQIEVRDWRAQAKAQGIEPDVLVDQFKAMILAGKVKQDAGDGDSNS